MTYLFIGMMIGVIIGTTIGSLAVAFKCVCQVESA